MWNLKLSFNNHVNAMRFLSPHSLPYPNLIKYMLASMTGGQVIDEAGPRCSPFTIPANEAANEAANKAANSIGPQTHVPTSQIA